MNIILSLGYRDIFIPDVDEKVIVALQGAREVNRTYDTSDPWRFAERVEDRPQITILHPQVTIREPASPVETSIEEAEAT